MSAARVLRFSRFAALAVFVAISSHQELFFPVIYGDNLNFENLVTYLNYLELAVGVVEDLNLNDKIGVKD